MGYHILRSIPQLRSFYNLCDTLTRFYGCTFPYGMFSTQNLPTVILRLGSTGCLFMLYSLIAHSIKLAHPG